MNQKPSVLIIDDTPANLRTLVAALSESYDLQISTSGKKGLEHVQAMPPDLILLDVMMPEMDGYEVCRRLKADPQTRHIPIIFITAMAESEAESRGLELGAVDYLTKPINVPIARKRIHNQLEREILRKEIELHQQQLEELVRARTMELSIAKEMAESANRLKSTILSNISHEFRTPMNGILGMVAMIRRRTDDARIQDYLLKAEHAANQLLTTLTSLLDLAHTESQRLTFAQSPFRPVDTISKAIEEIESALHAKSLSLVRPDSTNQSLSAWLVGDPLRVQQILHELISNAIKFSAGGCIEVSATVEHDDAGTLWLNCSVSDEGIGIVPENQQKVFEPFYQVDGSETRHYGGNGVGLALCRQLARHMGGDVSVKSEERRGTTFTLRIPVESCSTTMRAVV